MNELQKQIMRHLRKEYVMACRMDSPVMKKELKQAAKRYGVDPDLIVKGE